MSLLVRLHSSNSEKKFRKSTRNLRLRLDRFCIKHEKIVVRAKIISNRDTKLSFVRKWFPTGHILIINDADYEKWADLIQKVFSEWNPKIEQIIDFKEVEK